MKTVKYKTTGAFGSENEGTILDAILLAEESKATALLYHPRSPGCCACIEMCKKVGPYYVSLEAPETDMFGWINIGKQSDLDKLIERLKEISYKSDTRNRIEGK